MGSRHVLATRAGNHVIETRSLPGAYGAGNNAWMDPAAIPPPNFYSPNRQRAGVLVTPQTMLQVDVVWTAMRIITTAVLKMGDPRAYTEALSDDSIPYRKFLAAQPAVLGDTFGGRLMQYDGRRRTIMSMGLFGEAFWYVLDRDELEYPTALDVLHPLFMEVKTDKQGNPAYLYGSGAERKRLDPDDVIHIPFMALPQQPRALSNLEYAGVSVALAMAAYEFGSAWFSQGASPDFILSTDQKLGQREVQRIAEKFMVDHAGLSNSHLPLVLDSGLKAEKVMASPDEAQYLKSLEYSRNVIASWFGIPSSLLGNALERQTPQPAHTAEEEIQRFLAFTLSGYTIPLEEAYSRLVPSGLQVAFDESQLQRPDAQFMAQLIQALRQSQVATQNELRTRYLGLAPLDGGDSLVAPLASNTAPSQTEDPPSNTNE